MKKISGKNNKPIAAVLMAVLMVVVLAVPAFANTLPEVDPGWYVTFNAQGKMESNFTALDSIAGMQPGDTAIFKITVNNKYASDTNWYMENKVLYSLEDRSKDSMTHGGAYTYILTYTNPKGQVTELFNSDTVGGDTISKAGEGLKEATSGLDSYFLLDTLKANESALVTLTVVLEGETLGNNYQDTLADLNMDFAVELPEKETPPGPPKTGDSSNMLMYIIIAGIAAALLIFFVVFYAVRRKRAAADGTAILDDNDKEGKS